MICWAFYWINHIRQMELLCKVNSTDQIAMYSKFYWPDWKMVVSEIPLSLKTKRYLFYLFIGTPPSHPHYRPQPQRLLLELSIFTVYKRTDFSLLTEVRHELPGNMWLTLSFFIPFFTWWLLILSLNKRRGA